MTAGAIATYSLSIGGTGMSGTASLTCTGAPAGATCTVPPTIAINPTKATPFVVSVATSQAMSGAHIASAFRLVHWLWALAIVGLTVLPTGMNFKRSARQYLLGLVFLSLILCSCGGPGAGSNGGAPPGTYTLTVTATSGSASERFPSRSR